MARPPRRCASGEAMRQAPRSLIATSPAQSRAAAVDGAEDGAPAATIAMVGDARAPLARKACCLAQQLRAGPWYGAFGEVLHGATLIGWPARKMAWHEHCPG